MFSSNNMAHFTYTNLYTPSPKSRDVEESPIKNDILDAICKDKQHYFSWENSSAKIRTYTESKENPLTPKEAFETTPIIITTTPGRAPDIPKDPSKPDPDNFPSYAPRQTYIHVYGRLPYMVIEFTDQKDLQFMSLFTSDEDCIESLSKHLYCDLKGLVYAKIVYKHPCIKAAEGCKFMLKLYFGGKNPCTKSTLLDKLAAVPSKFKTLVHNDNIETYSEWLISEDAGALGELQLLNIKNKEIDAKLHYDIIQTTPKEIKFLSYNTFLIDSEGIDILFLRNKSAEALEEATNILAGDSEAQHVFRAIMTPLAYSLSTNKRYMGTVLSIKKLKNDILSTVCGKYKRGNDINAHDKEVSNDVRKQCFDSKIKSVRHDEIVGKFKLAYNAYEYLMRSAVKQMWLKVIKPIYMTNERKEKRQNVLNRVGFSQRHLCFDIEVSFVPFDESQEEKVTLIHTTVFNRAHNHTLSDVVFLLQSETRQQNEGTEESKLDMKRIEDIYNQNMGKEIMGRRQDIEVRQYKKESDLIIDFFNHCKKVGPVAIYGYNSTKYDWPFLFKRMEDLEIWGCKPYEPKPDPDNTGMPIKRKFFYVSLSYRDDKISIVYLPKNNKTLSMMKEEGLTRFFNSKSGQEFINEVNGEPEDRTLNGLEDLIEDDLDMLMDDRAASEISKGSSSSTYRPLAAAWDYKGLKSNHVALVDVLLYMPNPQQTPERDTPLNKTLDCSAMLYLGAKKLHAPCLEYAKLKETWETGDLETFIAYGMTDVRLTVLLEKKFLCDISFMNSTTTTPLRSLGFPETKMTTIRLMYSFGWYRNIYGPAATPYKGYDDMESKMLAPNYVYNPTDVPGCCRESCCAEKRETLLRYAGKSREIREKIERQLGVDIFIDPDKSEKREKILYGEYNPEEERKYHEDIINAKPPPELNTTQIRRWRATQMLHSGRILEVEKGESLEPQLDNPDFNILPPCAGRTITNVTGFYPDYMGCLFDFNSQYPSIMKGGNICLTTCVSPEWAKKNLKSHEYKSVILSNARPECVHACVSLDKCKMHAGINNGAKRGHKWKINYHLIKYEVCVVNESKFIGLAHEMQTTLLAERAYFKTCKKNAEDPIDELIYDGLQLNRKLASNSIYGIYLMLSPSVGGAITGEGRRQNEEVSRYFKDRVGKCCMSDTDSTAPLITEIPLKPNQEDCGPLSQLSFYFFKKKKGVPITKIIKELIKLFEHHADIINKGSKDGSIAPVVGGGAHIELEKFFIGLLFLRKKMYFALKLLPNQQLDIHVAGMTCIKSNTSAIISMTQLGSFMMISAMDFKGLTRFVLDLYQIGSVILRAFEHVNWFMKDLHSRVDLDVEDFVNSNPFVQSNSRIEYNGKLEFMEVLKMRAQRSKAAKEEIAQFSEEKEVVKLQEMMNGLWNLLDNQLFYQNEKVKNVTSAITPAQRAARLQCFRKGLPLNKASSPAVVIRGSGVQIGNLVTAFCNVLLRRKDPNTTENEQVCEQEVLDYTDREYAQYTRRKATSANTAAKKEAEFKKLKITDMPEHLKCQVDDIYLLPPNVRLMLQYLVSLIQKTEKIVDSERKAADVNSANSNLLFRHKCALKTAELSGSPEPPPPTIKNVPKVKKYIPPDIIYDKYELQRAARQLNELKKDYSLFPVLPAYWYDSAYCYSDPKDFDNGDEDGWRHVTDNNTEACIDFWTLYTNLNMSYKYIYIKGAINSKPIGIKWTNEKLKETVSSFTPKLCYLFKKNHVSLSEPDVIYELDMEVYSKQTVSTPLLGCGTHPNDPRRLFNKGSYIEPVENTFQFKADLTHLVTTVLTHITVKNIIAFAPVSKKAEFKYVINSHTFNKELPRGFARTDDRQVPVWCYGDTNWFIVRRSTFEVHVARVLERFKDKRAHVEFDKNKKSL